MKKSMKLCAKRLHTFIPNKISNILVVLASLYDDLKVRFTAILANGNALER